MHCNCLWQEKKGQGVAISRLFSYASSSTLYPCERVSESVIHSFGLHPSSVAWSLRACYSDNHDYYYDYDFDDHDHDGCDDNEYDDYDYDKYSYQDSDFKSGIQLSRKGSSEFIQRKN